MRVLIVNNGKRYPDKIAALFSNHDVETVAQTEVARLFPVAPHDCLVLTGSNQKPIPYFHDEIRHLLDWIPQQSQPLLGICYGAELIVEAYGGTLHHLGPEHKQKGFFTTDTSAATWPLLQPFCAYEAHQWIIKSLVAPLQPVISSSRGILAFEHESLPQAGCMFHPEKYRDETDGYLFFTEFLRRHNIQVA